MEISYKKVGDYYIPEMVFPNAKPDKNIGKYGRLRLNYLKHNHKDIYIILLMDDKLNEHLLDIEKEAKEAGVTAFCSKPLFMSELRGVLAQPFSEYQDDKSDQENESASMPDFSGKRVLLAEDNELNQILAENILTSVGLDVDIASDGTEAVEKVKSANPGYYDVILMDVQMPHMDGYEATRQIRALEDKADIPIIAVTANAFDEDRQVALDAGMNGHLAKPYNIPEIIKTLKELLN